MASLAAPLATGIRWAAWSAVPCGVLLLLAILGSLALAPIGLLTFLPHEIAMFIVCLFAPAVLTITVGWSAPAHWRPAVERNAALAHLFVLAWALVVLSAVQQLFQAFASARKGGQQLPILAMAVAVFLPRLLVRSLRRGGLEPTGPATRRLPPAKATHNFGVLPRVAAFLIGVGFLVTGSIVLLVLGIGGAWTGFDRRYFVIFSLAHVYVYGTVGLSLLFALRPRKLLGGILLALYLSAACLFAYGYVQGKREQAKRQAIGTHDPVSGELSR